MAAKEREASTNPAGRFGTFAGVFTPNILTILGIILFLRTGYVVGQAGLFGGLAIVAIANTISLLTGLSLSAVATNMRVRAGGNYYLISRSLGLEIGGAIGIPLYLSQAISVAFYIIGFTESLLALPFFAEINPQIIATVVTLVFVVIAYIGADFALKIQYVVLAILLTALVSFFAGALRGFGSGMEPVLDPAFTEGITFWVVFAVFFPAVTGIEVGTSLSGDLKEPSKSIPLGTIASIIFTAIIYFAVVLLFAFNAPREGLVNDNLIMQQIALVPELILTGVWASTLSSALGSVLAAPRTLQAIANDGIVPEWIASNLGSRTEPRMAVLLTGLVAIGVIWMGELNFVAPIITMFFLNTYGMVNLTASVERLVGNPSFRPRFRIPWYISMLGALGCYGAMFLINPVATVFAIVVSYGFYFLLQRRQLLRTWGDVRSGVWFALARFALLNLEQQAWHQKNWRPNIMVFTGQPHNRQQLVQVAEWLSLGRGLVTFFQLIIGEVDKRSAARHRDTARRHIQQYIEQHGMKAFAEAEIVPSFHEGALMLAQAHGIGNLQSNTILMGWSRTPPGRAAQLDLMRELYEIHKSVLFLNYDSQRGFGKRRRINIWWQGRGGNEDLMLLLAYIISGHRDWRKSEIYLLRVVKSAEAVDSTRAHMNRVLGEVRVNAKPVVIVPPDPSRPLTQIISHNSEDADLTIIGMRVPREEEEVEYAERLDALVQVVGSVLLVRNAEVVDDLLVTD